MPDQGRALAHEIGIYYYETSVFTYYGVNEVFENAIRAALMARRQQRFWMTNLKRVQRPLFQVMKIVCYLLFALMKKLLFMLYFTGTIQTTKASSTRNCSIFKYLHRKHDQFIFKPGSIFGY